MSFGAIVGIRRLDVSLTDLGISGGSFGFGLDNLTFVPEPSTALLLATGLAALGVRRRGRPWNL